MDIAIAPYVAETRKLYRELAQQENVPLATIVHRQYADLLIREDNGLAAIDANARRGNLPEVLTVDEWTPDAANLMLAIATVVLEVEFGESSAVAA